jgi:hypothetical protein
VRRSLRQPEPLASDTEVQIEQIWIRQAFF